MIRWIHTDFAMHIGSHAKKAWTASLVTLYTAVVYGSSAIYVPSILLVEERFGVGAFKASLGLALYVLGTLVHACLMHWRFIDRV